MRFDSGTPKLAKDTDGGGLTLELSYAAFGFLGNKLNTGDKPGLKMDHDQTGYIKYVYYSVKIIFCFKGYHQRCIFVLDRRIGSIKKMSERKNIVTQFAILSRFILTIDYCILKYVIAAFRSCRFETIESVGGIGLGRLESNYVFGTGKDELLRNLLDLQTQACVNTHENAAYTTNVLEPYKKVCFLFLNLI